jgi:hypothetical protein
LEGETMLLSRSRLIGTGLAVAAVAGVAALAYGAISGARNLPRLTAERGHAVAAVAAAEPSQLVQARDRKETPAAKDTLPAPKDQTASGKAPPARESATPPDASDARETGDRAVHVEAPDTDVDVDGERGKVRVRAPYTKVDVDPDRGRVRVRAPYVNLDIRW